MDSGGEQWNSPFNPEPSIAVIEAVAEAENVPLEELCPPEYPPLHDVINTDALDQLFESPATDVTVTFPYLTYQISLESNGHVEIDVREE
ncbi:HalOD1 output domain-containing protein [Natronosalvus vescus]|uniref:HalOD1 output domain-containing protein n=1 Tax=Natronosalvus vescus TaxID=2953881 RepID=UPI0020901747|nr:HalOD1 output domain-containing protein [Natronosalvus vescus]